MTNEKMNYEKLKVDKENSTVSYNDEFHKYWIKDTKQDCVSVTTLIHGFAPEFDSDFWSKYKALQALLPKEQFDVIKKSLNATKRFHESLISSLKVDPVLFEEKRQEILEEWAEKNRVACERGTAIHLEHEKEHLSGNTKELQKLGLGGKFSTDTSNNFVGGVQAVHPELLLSRVSDDRKLRIAGQADLIIIDDWDVYVLDYKTNAKIDTKSFFNGQTKKSATMNYPLNNIQDSNFWHYSLQLSTYAWMIQKIDPRFNIKLLQLIHYDHEGGCTTYECDYLKNDVERMLAYYKKQKENDEYKKQNERIKF